MASNLNVKVEGNELVIRLPIKKVISKTGKSIVIASTNGNKQTDVVIDGKPVTVGVNAYYSNRAE